MTPIKIPITIVDGRSMPWVLLQEVNIIDRRIFKSTEEQNNYKRLFYDVLKVWPYAQYAKQIYLQLERELAATSNKRLQRAMIKIYAKNIRDLFNREIRNLTIAQGNILN